MAITNLAIDHNPYAAPQAALVLETRPLPVAKERTCFPGYLVWQGLRTGAMAGGFASLVMLFVYVIRYPFGAEGTFTDLLGTCACFTLVTASLGLFWGLNHAGIVWCLRRWRSDAWTME